MVATEGFRTAKDTHDVRTVELAGGASFLLEFWQEAGRGGRCGKAVDVHVLFYPSHLVRANGGQERVPRFPAAELSARGHNLEVATHRH